MQARSLRYRATVFWGLLAVFVGVQPGAPPPADAMHETDHRFTISGYVRDKDGRPVGDARVRIRDLLHENIDPVTTYTDGNGYYKAILHLHNENAGDSLQVKAIEEKAGLEEVKTVRAEFNPEDRKTEREIRVDLGPSIVGASEDVVSTVIQPRGWYAAGGALVIAVALAIVWARYRASKASQKSRRKKRSSVR
jgi:hypothetical protein